MSSPLLVACLCAAWCGTCREYEPLFERLREEFSGQAAFAALEERVLQRVLQAPQPEGPETLPPAPAWRWAV